jgi:hypothetical protein
VILVYVQSFLVIFHSDAVHTHFDVFKCKVNIAFGYVQLHAFHIVSYRITLSSCGGGFFKQVDSLLEGFDGKLQHAIFVITCAFSSGFMCKHKGIANRFRFHFQLFIRRAGTHCDQHDQSDKREKSLFWHCIPPVIIISAHALMTAEFVNQKRT